MKLREIQKQIEVSTPTCIAVNNEYCLVSLDNKILLFPLSYTTTLYRLVKKRTKQLLVNRECLTQVDSLSEKILDYADYTEYSSRSKTFDCLVCTRDVSSYLDQLPSIVEQNRILPILIIGSSVFSGPKLLGRSMAEQWAHRLKSNIPLLTTLSEGKYRLLSLLSHSQKKTILRNETSLMSDNTLCIRYLVKNEKYREFFFYEGMPGGEQAKSPRELVGKHGGLIHSIGKPQQTYEFFSNYSTYCPSYPNIRGGASGLDEEATKLRAVYEFIERYCLKVNPETVEEAHESSNDEKERLAPFTDSPEAILAKEFKLNYALVAKDILTNQRVLFPKDLFYPSKERNTLFSYSSTGTAAGASLEDAQMRAICEIAERDIATRAFYDCRLWSLDLRDYDIEEYRVCISNALDVQLYVCETNLPILVFISFMHDKKRGYSAYGVSAAFTVQQGIIHAMEEGIHMLVHNTQRRRQIVLADWLAAGVDTYHGVLHDFKQKESLRCLIEHYKPLTYQYENAVLSLLKCSVVKAVSGYAVDFPSQRGQYLYKDWLPSAKAKRALTDKRSLLN